MVQMICRSSFGDDRFKLCGIYNIIKKYTRDKTEYVLVDLGSEQVELPALYFNKWYGDAKTDETVQSRLGI